MRRMPIALASMAVAALAVALPARALAAGECVCGVSDANPYGGWGYLEAVESVDPELLMDRAIDPSELETPDPHAVRGVVPSRGDRIPSVLWCTHTNDPRCSPLTPEDEPTPRSLPQAAPMLAPEAPRLPGVRLTSFTSEIAIPAVVAQTDPSDPHVRQPERPPRA
jgi:hypothetical protein